MNAHRPSLEWKRARALESRREAQAWRGGKYHAYWVAEYHYDRRRFLAHKRGLRHAAMRGAA